MKAIAVVGIELGMLAGIVTAAFVVPRSTPLLTFGIISVAPFAVGNLLLLRSMRQAHAGDGRGIGARRNRNLNLIIVLFIGYWLVCFLLRKH